MTELFFRTLNVSLSASWLVLAVLVLRLLLKKAPKWVPVLLWGLVAVRLVCPITLESSASLVPDPAPITQAVLGELSEVEFVPPNNRQTSAVQPTQEIPVQEAHPITTPQILTGVWLTGTAAMLLYAIISDFRLRRRMTTAVPLRDNICQSERVSSPFVLGFLRPRIYLPFSLSPQEADYVLAHEQAHIQRGDHWWKPLGFLLLSIHWFNPLLWLAYILLCRDIELACDARVIRKFSREQRADYAQALLSCSVRHSAMVASPLAFGEVGVKARVSHVLNDKKPAFWVVSAAILVCIIAAVCFLTDPVDRPQEMPPNGRTAEVWFDYWANPDEMNWEETKETTLPEYPKVTFRWTSDKVEAVTDTETTELYTGMPVWNVFFWDLTGDGKRELCSTLSFGSGVVDERILIYDYAGGASYELSDRGEFDYTLRFQNDRLYVDQWRYPHEALIDSGELSFADGCLQIIRDGSPLSPSGGVDEAQSPNPVSTEDAATLDDAITAAVLAHSSSDQPDGLIHVESHVILEQRELSGTPLVGSTEHQNLVTVYAMVLEQQYSSYGGKLTQEGGSRTPAALTFSVDPQGRYTLTEYWTPRDGGDYGADLESKFPKAVVEKVFHDETNAQQQKECDEKAQAILQRTGSIDRQIAALLDTLCSSPAESSAPGDYLRAHPEEHALLLNYGAFTLRYCFDQFLQGGQTDLRGHIMALVCQEIMDQWDESSTLDRDYTTGQHWFDLFAQTADKLAGELPAEEVEKYHPGAWLLLEMRR